MDAVPEFWTREQGYTQQGESDSQGDEEGVVKSSLKRWALDKCSMIRQLYQIRCISYFTSIWGFRVMSSILRSVALRHTHVFTLTSPHPLLFLSDLDELI